MLISARTSYQQRRELAIYHIKIIAQGAGNKDVGIKTKALKATHESQGSEGPKDYWLKTDTALVFGKRRASEVSFS